MKRVLCLLLCATPAWAEIAFFNLSTTGEAELGALIIDEGDVFEYDPVTDTPRLLLDVSAHFVSGGDIDAIQALSDTTFILSTGSNSQFNNGTRIDDGDVVLYDAATGNVTLLIDDDAHFRDNKNKLQGANVDAIQRLDNGNLLLSIDTTGRFLDGTALGLADFVEYNVGSGALVRKALANSSFTTRNDNVDGAHERSNGNVVLSTDNNAVLGGLTFDNDDIVEYDPVSGTATLLVNGAEILSGTGNTRTNALSVRPSGKLVLVANTAAFAGGQLGAEDVARYDIAADTSQRIFNGSAVFSASEDVDAVHVATDGTLYLSTASAATIGALNFQPEDVVAYDPVTGGATLFFDGSARLASSRNVDSFALLDNGQFILSVSGGSDTLGGVTFGVSDLVQFDPATNTATLIFDGDALFSAAEDVDGAHVLSTGELLLSTTSSATLGGLSFGREDIVQYDAGAGTALLVFDGSSLFDTTGEDVNAVHAEEAVVLGNVDHFQIVHAGQAINCQAEPVSIRAMDAAGVLIADYEGTVQISTSAANGDWTNGDGVGTFSPGAADSGAATYTFVVADGGEVTLNLRDTHVETLSINVLDGGGVSERSNNAVAADDPDLQFVSSGFRFYEGSPASLIQTQIANKSSATAPNAGGLGLQAIRTDTQTGACEAFLVGDTAVEMAFACVNPAACAASGVTVTGSGASVALPEWNGGANYQPVTLNFGANTTDRAPFTMLYPEAGSIRLFARLVLDPGTTQMAGQSNAFVVRPFGLQLTAISSGVANPGGTASAGNVFAAAGESFSYTVGAYRWAAGEDDDGDGVPNVGAVLTDNGLTTQFAGVVEFSVGEITPTGPGAVSGVLGTGTVNVTSGGNAAVTGQTYSEVGSLRIRSAHLDYLGDGAADMEAQSAVIGRFVPDRFEVPTGSVNEAVPPGDCADGLVYMDEPDLQVTYDLRALSVAGDLTTNYDAARGYAFTGAVDVVAEQGDNGVDLSGRLSFANAMDWVAGQVAFDETSVIFARTAGVDGPFSALQVGVRIAGDPVDGIGDPDNVNLAAPDMNASAVGCGTACDATALSGVPDIRQGRLLVLGAYGPETESLPLPVRAEYFDGTAFVTATADVCTTLPGSQVDLAFVDDDSSPDHSSDPASGVLTVPVDTSSSTGSILNNPFVSGAAGLVFSAPGAGNTGYIDVDVLLGAMPWLQHDWDGDGVHGENPPTARAVFGRYRGDDRILYWREVIE